MKEMLVADISGMDGNMRIVVGCIIVVAAYIVDFLCCQFLVPLIQNLAKKTSFNWDDHLTNDKVLKNMFHLIPPVTFYVALPLILPLANQWVLLLQKVCIIYIIVLSCRLVCGFITSLYAISHDNDVLRDKPMKGVYQMIKVVVIGVSVILVIGVLLEKDFTSLLAGLGASAAVLMLVFKDTIMGVVAGVQLSAHDMLRPGDWIVLDKYGINGVVIEVSLNTVKVRSWDNTIVTIPPYVLVSDSFKNWRGMVESGGRRVARSIYIDMNSIRFCNDDELKRFSGEEWFKTVDVSAGIVNLKLFRTYVEHYLRQHEMVNEELTLMVRQLQPVPEGLPVELYFFCREKTWVPYEKVQSDIMEHVFAVVPMFGLKIFQRPSGEDVRSAIEGRSL